MKSFTLVVTLWVTWVKNPSVYLENWHRCCSGGLLEFQVRAFLTCRGHSEENPLTTLLLASSKSYSSQRLSQINLVNQSLRELQQSGRDSNFFHLYWNVALLVPNSLNTNYLLFVLNVFPVGRRKTVQRKQWKHSLTARTASIFSWNYSKWCNGTVIGFHRQENHRYTHTHRLVGETHHDRHPEPVLPDSFNATIWSHTPIMEHQDANYTEHFMKLLCP